ncbi:MAG: type II toxin-antitoxin system VapC family toxin [Actinomycetota bacterium]|nr:type II toxin-antitoxin system VapC family toxin [Actinomycetota bacterium]MDI6822488.1 type II toxin-antitoxin system VapC family toxin [Actinomycetota bacterium]
MAKYLMDTDVIIWYLRGKEDTVSLIKNLSKEGELAISAISRTEILMGTLEKERTATEEFLNALSTYNVDVYTADMAGDFIKEYRAKGITLEIPDALIAATAIANNLTLVTYNKKHYPMVKSIL